MYNGIGLQTPRGSGTNGYIQNNKFFVRPKSTGKPVNGGKGFEDGQGMAGLSKKPNKDILEHDRKRQIHLKLAVLEEKLIDQGYSDSEIAQKLEEARKNLETATSAYEENGAPADAKISDTQTHQIAARKEKQMETFRAALGLPNQQTDEGGVDGEPKSEAYEGAVGRLKERREHSFLDRDGGRMDEGRDEKDGKGKSTKKQKKQDDTDEPRRHKKKESKKRRHDSDDSSDSSDSESDRERRKPSKKKAKGRKLESESDSSDNDSESDSEEKRRKGGKKRRRSKRYDSSDSEVESDVNKKHGKVLERHRASDRFDSEEESDRYRGRRREEPTKRQRHDADDSETKPEDRNDENKKDVYVHERYRPSERSDSEEELDRYRGRRREEPIKRQRHGSDDSETEPVDRRQRRRDDSDDRGMKHRRDEEDDRDYKHGRDRQRDDGAAGSKRRPAREVSREEEDVERVTRQRESSRKARNYHEGRSSGRKSYDGRA